jgi:hypothetical protein
MDDNKIRVQDPRLAEKGEKLWKEEYDGGEIYTYKTYDEEHTKAIFTEEGEMFTNFKNLYVIIPKEDLYPAHELQERCGCGVPLYIHRDDIEKVQKQAVELKYEDNVLHRIVETEEGLTIRQNRSEQDGIVEEGDFIKKTENFVDYWDHEKKYVDYSKTTGEMKTRTVTKRL